MVVVHIHSDGRLRAKYAHKGLILKSDYNYPYDMPYSCKTRYPNEFVSWDGKPINKGHYIMSKEQIYMSTVTPTVKGTKRGETSTGELIIEDSVGNIYTIPKEYAIEILPNTFKCRALNGSYSCHYLVPEGVNVDYNDLIISESGNVYTVIAVDTKALTNKGVFKGKRLVTVDL